MDSRGHIVYGTDFSHGKVLFILLSKIVFLPGKPMGRGACWATVHGVAKSRTQLSDYTRTHTPQTGKCGRIPSTQCPCSRPVLRDRKQNRGDQKSGARQRRVTVLWIWPTSPRKYMPVCRLISSQTFKSQPNVDFTGLRSIISWIKTHIQPRQRGNTLQELHKSTSGVS